MQFFIYFNASSYFFAEIPSFHFKMFVEGAAPSFKGDNGKTEKIEVVNGTKEKRLPCKLTTDSANFTWFKNGHRIRDSAKHRIKIQRHLKIKDVGFGDQGVYVCQVSNTQGSVNKTIYLIVTGRSNPGAGCIKGV